MRLRVSLLPVVFAATLVVAPMAAADPLDEDDSFGTDGTVDVERGLATMTAIAASGPRLYVAGGGHGAGSGESTLTVTLRGRHGAAVRSQSGYLEQTSDYPVVADVMVWRHRVFAVGWLANGYSWEKDKKVPDYGFAAGFRTSLLPSVRWGPDSYTYSDNPHGLQRLRGVDFGNVTGGAVDRRGRVLVLGRLDGQTAVLRLTRDGHIDHSYGTNGLATVSVGSGSSPRDITVHGTNALVVGNATTNGTKQGFAAKITGYGFRDHTFSGDGIRRIGKPGTFATAVDTADAGRWLVGYESGERAGVSKLGTTGDLITTFGRAGRASVRCTRPHDRQVVDALATDRGSGHLSRVTLAISCERNGELRRLAAMWRAGGKPITSLRPDGVGRLPWGANTLDIIHGWRHRLVGLNSRYLVRLR